MIKDDEVFSIGHISKCRGIKGEVELTFFDDAFDRGSSDFIVLKLDGILVPFFWEEYKFKNDNTAIFKIEGVDIEEQAKQLVGTEVLYPFSALPAEEERALTSWAALKNFSVLTAQKELIGHVAYVNDSSVNVLLALETPQGKEVLIPFHEDFVVNVDVRQKTLEVELPEGLLEIND